MPVRSIGVGVLLVASALALIPLLAPVIASLAAFAAGEIPAFLANKDFANYWIAARLVLAGDVQDIFAGHETYFAHMQAAFGADYPWHAWSYPPHYLLFIWPLGLFPYAAAIALFLGVTLALYLLAARKFIGTLRGPALVLLLPFVIFNVWAAQNGFLTGALLLGALAWRHERPVLAGVFAGCLTIKPQLGLLLPFLFLLEGRWLTIASATATTAALAAISAFVFGADVWAGFFTGTLPYQARQMNGAGGVFLNMMPSLSVSLRNFGMEPGSALAVHLMAVLPVAGFALRTFVTSGDPALRACILIIATSLITPYSFAYDLGAVSAALAAFILGSPAMKAGENGILFLTALLPLAILPLGLIGLPIAPLLLAAAFFVLIRRASAGAALRPAAAPS